MPDEFPSVSLPAGGYRRDFPEPEAPLDPGPTDISLIEAAQKQADQLPKLESDIEEMDEKLKLGRGWLDQGGLVNLGLSFLPGGETPRWDPALVTSRHWDPQWLNMGTSLEDEYFQTLDKLEVKHPKIPEDQAGMIGWLLSYVLNEDTVNTWSEDNPLYEKGKKGERDVDVANALNFYAMKHLGFQAQDLDELYKELPVKIRKRLDVNANTEKLIQQNVANGNVDAIYVGVLNGQPVGVVPRFAQEVNDDLATTMVDPILRELYRVRVPEKLLRDSARGWQNVTLEGLKNSVDEQEWSRVAEMWKERRTSMEVFGTHISGQEEVFGEYVTVPMYETFDGEFSFDLDELEYGLVADYTERRALQLGLNPYELTDEQNEEIKRWAETKVKREVAPIKHLGRGLIHSTDADKQLRRYNRGEGLLGGTSHIAQHLAYLGLPLVYWNMPGGSAQSMPLRPGEVLMDTVQPVFGVPRSRGAKITADALKIMAAQRGRDDLVERLDKIGDGWRERAEDPDYISYRKVHADDAEIRSIAEELNGDTDLATIMEQMWKWESPTHVEGRWVKAWLANLLPTRRLSGVVTREGKIISYDRDEGLFGKAAQDWANPDSILSDISPMRALDWVIRFAPSEAVGSAFAMARQKWGEDEMDRWGLSDRDKAQWTSIEVAQVIGQPKMLDRLTKQDTDIGVYMSEFGEAYYDWMPDVSLGRKFGTIEFGAEDDPEIFLSLRGVAGFSTVALQFGLEFDGILAGVFLHSGYKAGKRAVRRKLGTRDQDQLRPRGEQLLGAMGERLSGAAQEEFQRQFKAVTWGKKHSETGFARVYSFIQKAHDTTKAHPTPAMWEEAFNTRQLAQEDLSSFIYGLQKMSEDVAGAGDAIFNVGITRFLGSQAIDEGSNVADILRLIEDELGNSIDVVRRNRTHLAERLAKLGKATDEQETIKKAIEYVEESKKLLVQELDIKYKAWQIAATQRVTANKALHSFMQSIRLIGLGSDLGKVDPNVAKLFSMLDNPEMLQAAMRVGRKEMSVEDFLKAYGHNMKQLGIKVGDDGIKELVLSAFTRLGTEPRAIRAYRTLQKLTRVARDRTLVYEQLKSVYVTAKGSLTKDIIDQFTSVGIRTPELGISMGLPEARNVLENVLAELKVLEDETIVMQELFAGAMKVLEEPYAGLAGKATRLVNSLWDTAESVVRQGALDDADIAAFKNSWVGTGAHGFIEALSRPKSGVPRAAEKFFPEQRQIGPRGAPREAEIGIEELEMIYTAEKVRSVWADPNSVFHTFRTRRLPHELAATSRELGLATRNTIAARLGYPDEAVKTNWFAAWNKWYQTRSTWIAYTGIQIKKTAENFPIFNRWIKANPAKFHEGVQLGIRRHLRRMRGIETSINLVIEHAPNAERAFDDLLDLFSQEGGIHVVMSKYAKKIRVPGTNKKVTLQAALPYLGVDRLTISAIADLNESLIRMGLRHIQGERFAYQSQAGMRGAGQIPKTSEDSMILTAIIKAYIDEGRGVMPPPKELDKLLEEVRTYVHKKFDWDSVNGIGPNLSTDRRLFEKMEEHIIDGIRLQESTVHPVNKSYKGEMGARYANAREKHLRLLLSGASTELLDGTLRTSLGMRSVGPETADYMNFINRDYRGASIGAQTAARTARPWAAGDWVVDMEETELFGALFRELEDFTYHPTRPPGARIEAKPKEARASVDYAKPQAGRPWWREVVGYKPEQEELWATWARYPEWEAAWRNKVGQKPAEQILKVDEAARTVTLTDGRVRSFESIARRDIRIGWFDALDGNARWGFEAFATPGIKKRFDDQMKIVRNQHTAMVLRGNGRSGLNALPFELQASMNEQIGNLTKVLDEWYSVAIAEADTSFIRRFINGTARSIRTSLRGWRQHILFGLLVPRVAYVPIQWFQDAANLTYYHGIEGTALSLVGGVAMFPYVGKVVQDQFFKRVAKLSPDGRLPGATFLSAFTDRNWGKFYAGSNDVAMIENGVPVTFRQMLAEAEMAGAREWIGLEDYAQASHRLTKQVLSEHGTRGWYEHAIETGAMTYNGIHRQFQIGIQDAVGRMRAVTYWYYRVQKRMSIDEAEKMLDRTLINWSDSVSAFEKKWFGSTFLFYTLHKNSFLQVMDAFTEMSELGRTLPEQWLNYGNKYLTFSTRAQRLRMMSRYMTQPAQWAPSPGQPMTAEEAQTVAMRGDISRWLGRYPIVGMPQRATAGQMEQYWKYVGRKFDFVVPTLPLISQLEYLTSTLEAAEIILAIPVMGLQLVVSDGTEIPYAVDPGMWAREAGQFGGSFLNPLADAMMTSIMYRMSGESLPVSQYGGRAAVGNTYLLENLTRLGVGVQDSLVETYEYKGETRIKYKLPLLGWATKEFVVDPLSKELDMFHLYLGFVTGKRDLSSAKVKTLLETDEHFRVRYEAAREIFGLYRKSLISTEQERLTRVRGQTREKRELETKAESKLIQEWSEYMKEDRYEQPWWLYDE